MKSRHLFSYTVLTGDNTRLDSVTYFRPGSCGGKIFFKFSDKKLNCSTLTARNFFWRNFIKIMKTYVNLNTLKLSLLQKWRRDVLVQYLKTCKAKTFFYWAHSNLRTSKELLTVISTLPRVFIKTYGCSVVVFS